MPVIYQKFVYRADLKANPKVLYLFGDNLIRFGLGGQAKEMRGEPNAVGIPTKRTPSMNEDAFFSDEDFDEIAKVFEDSFELVHEHLLNDGIVVIPFDGLGTGFSQLPTRAPKINALLEQELKTLGEYV